MKNKLYIFLVLFMLLGAYGCEKLHDWNQPEDPETEFSSTYPLSGEWWVTYYVEDGDGGLIPITDYLPLFTYNTAADDGKEMWIGDDGSFWNYRVKTPCDVPGLQFASVDTLTSTADGSTSIYDINMVINNGRVIKSGGHSTSGVVVDSIYLEMRFSDDGHMVGGVWVEVPYETLYIAAGVRKTGFLEDEH